MVLLLSVLLPLLLLLDLLLLLLLLLVLLLQLEKDMRPEAIRVLQQLLMGVLTDPAAAKKRRVRVANNTFHAAASRKP